MLFNSQVFLAFFVLVWAGYWLLRSRREAQNALLLVASYVFYGYWDWRFLGLILFSTVVDYFVGLGLGAPEASARRRRGLLTVSLLTNLGLLGFFKYFNFFADSLRELLLAIGLHPAPWTLAIVLPVGISFYTFQTLSYSIDRYRGDIPVERSFLSFAFFVSFFPQLVAGPIVRAREFLPAANRPRRFRWEDQADGLQLALWGLFKKAVVADNLAPFVDAVYGSEGPVGSLAVVFATYAFAVQIYCDFSGYTDIARGTARMLGFRFPLNFRRPYFVGDPSAFWRRWHMTLSLWLRDYLYISLGGNRRGEGRTYVNLMATMVLGGLWHGAAWNFVLWGFYQGLLLIVYRLWETARRERGERSLLGHVVACAFFFQLVCLGWLFFRAESWDQIVALLTPSGGGLLAGVELSVHIARGLVLGGVGTLVLFVWDLVQERRERVHPESELPDEGASPWSRAALACGLYLAISLFGNFVGDEFIYFQF